MDYPACHPGSPARLPNHLAPRPAGGMHMSSHTLSHETRRALDNLKAYLAGENEAVQYAFSFLADMVTQNPSAMLGRTNLRSLFVIDVTLRSHELERPRLVPVDPLRGFFDCVLFFQAD